VAIWIGPLTVDGTSLAMLATLVGPPEVVGVGLDPPHAAIKHAMAIAKDDVRILITILSLDPA
jgi:predicted RNA methylase